MFGRSGQVARELARSAGPDILLTALDRSQAELSDPQVCADWIARSEVDVVINAAAYTEVDAAEDNEAVAMKINADAPLVMARACADRGLTFIQISSDYVFDGSQEGAWKECDPARPINAYGRSKLYGEQAVQATGGKNVILRTSWIFSSHGQNFVKKMLQISKATEFLEVVNDQFGGPTPASGIAASILTIAQAFQADKGVPGIYHYSGTPNVSWYEFAHQVLDMAGDHRETVLRAIVSCDRPTKAARPRNSTLNCSKIKRIYGIDQADWQASLAGVLNEIKEREFCDRS